MDSKIFLKQFLTKQKCRKEVWRHAFLKVHAIYLLAEDIKTTRCLNQCITPLFSLHNLFSFQNKR